MTRIASAHSNRVAIPPGRAAQSRATLPPPVLPGDRIGVAALSGPVDPTRLDAGLAALRQRYEVVEAPNLRTQAGLFAGHDEERVEAFHALATDPDLGAIVFARGGYGAMRILDALDWKLLEQHPRAYVGYSDLTPFLLAIVERLGLVAFHGPMAAAEHAEGLLPEERRSFEDALAGRFPEAFELPHGAPASGEICDGILLGGCLSLLAATVGTPWAPRLDGGVLVIEDLEEPLYRLDRMLTQLRLSGSLDGVHGLVFGHLTRDGGRPCEASWIDRLLEGFDKPWASGLAAGHARPNLTLPLGLPVQLDPSSRCLRLTGVRR